MKAIGSAWAWDHEYLDQKFTVSSNMIGDEDVLKEKLGEDAFNEKYGALEGAARHNAVYINSKPMWKERNEPRRLTVDNDIVLPVNKVVHMLVTSTDVIHQWTIPSFGVKMQAVPGRTAAVWFQPNKTGTFRGQCSVLCGKLHSAMPIAVRVVEQPIYDGWVAALKRRSQEGQGNLEIRSRFGRSKASRRSIAITNKRIARWAGIASRGREKDQRTAGTRASHDGRQHTQRTMTLRRSSGDGFFD